MKKQRLIWQLFSPLWLITILALLAATIFISHYFKKIYLAQAAEDLQAQAFFARSFLSNFIIDGNEQAADSLCEYLGRETDTRLTVILRTGRVIGDSRGDPANMTDHSNRPEIAAAFDDETGISTRYSYTLHISLMYVAVPVRVEDQIVGVVRASKPISAINEALVGINVKIAISWLVIVLLIVFTGFIGSRRLNASLKQMQQGAQQYSGGDFSYRLPEQSSFELSQLTGAMNRMAFELDSRIRTILQQRNEQQAVLSSMVEGVMAIDRNERIINLNSAAENLLGVSCDQAKNCYVHEAIRNTQLQKFVRKALVAAEPVEGNITIYDEGEKSIQAHGAILRDAGGNNVGAVIVLNDMTRLRKLENIRREFVANVSHELKTPITAIKGFVETLMDGALKNPGDTEQFLQVVLKHANRLNAIIDDLLKLSRIEQEAEREEIALYDSQIKKVLQSSIQLCEPGASARGIKIQLDCADDIKAGINPDIFQQAVINLLDNAIKFSPDNSLIKVEAVRENNEIRISVIDRGPGIAAEHLPRLFERFYRVDREKSRKLGGTGLGLAIVKHIVLAHKARIDVESKVGTGSKFSIYLPDVSKSI